MSSRIRKREVEKAILAANADTEEDEIAAPPKTRQRRELKQGRRTGDVAKQHSGKRSNKTRPSMLDDDEVVVTPPPLKKRAAVATATDDDSVPSVAVPVKTASDDEVSTDASTDVAPINNDNAVMVTKKRRIIRAVKPGKSDRTMAATNDTSATKSIPVLFAMGQAHANSSVATLPTQALPALAPIRPTRNRAIRMPIMNPSNDATAAQSSIPFTTNLAAVSAATPAPSTMGTRRSVQAAAPLSSNDPFLFAVKAPVYMPDDGIHMMTKSSLSPLQTDTLSSPTNFPTEATTSSLMADHDGMDGATTATEDAFTVREHSSVDVSYLSRWPWILFLLKLFVILSNPFGIRNVKEVPLVVGNWMGKAQDYCKKQVAMKEQQGEGERYEEETAMDEAVEQFGQETAMDEATATNETATAPLEKAAWYLRTAAVAVLVSAMAAILYLREYFVYGTLLAGILRGTQVVARTAVGAYRTTVRSVKYTILRGFDLLYLLYILIGIYVGVNIKMMLYGGAAMYVVLRTVLTVKVNSILTAFGLGTAPFLYGADMVVTAYTSIWEYGVPLVWWAFRITFMGGATPSAAATGAF